MKNLLTVCAAAALLGAWSPSSQSRTICTVMVDAASGATVHQQGDCSTRYTPASTFKIALSVMGFDAGFLKSAHAPSLPFQDGYVTWGGNNWRQATDPTRWMKYSVVWYSQQITQHLGADKLARYASAWGYGNADFTGDPGKQNGLARSWISSSLKISPLEQTTFLRGLVNDSLPVSAHAMVQTRQILESRSLPDGWVIQGKTGMAYPRMPNGEFDEDRPFGWYVGWAEKDERKLVFARLIQDEVRTAGTAGVRSREAFFNDFPALVRP